MRIARLGRCLVSSIVVSATFVVGIVVAPPAHAVAFLTKASPASGFQTPGFGSWYQADATMEQFSSAAFGDLNGDGVPDIVAGFPDGMVYAWRVDTGARWFAFSSGAGAVQGSPSIVDLNGDGVKEVLVSNTGGDVKAVDALNRTVFSVHLSGGPGRSPGVFATPVASDINGDGVPEVIATSWDQFLHVWTLNGAELPGFPVWLQDTSWSSPAVADLDGDGRKEIVFGYDCDGVDGQNCSPARGGYIGVVEPDGSWRPGFPHFTPDQVVWSSPALVDLTGDGRLDIVVGTGNMNMPGGRVVYGLDANGNNLPGWPVAVGGLTTSSPAIGDIDGDGVPEVAIVADDGKVYAIRANGSIMWSRCIANDTTNGCPRVLHASPSIADVLGHDGLQEVVVGGEQWLNVFDGNGNMPARGETVVGTFPMTAAPTIASVGSDTWLIEVTGASNGQGGWVGEVFAWKTGSPLGNAAWPTFHQNFRRTGSLLDEVPPSVSLTLPATSASRNVTVSWQGTDNPGGSGIAGYDVDTSDNGQPFVRWLTNTAQPGATLWGFPGHTMQVRVRARDRAGNVSGFVTKSVAISAQASGAPFTQAYAVGSRGQVSGYDSPPVQGPNWSYPIARGIAAVPGGGFVLDGWGGLQPWGSITPPAVTGYWPGQDIARGIAMSSDSTWGYVLDWWGAIHPVGSAPYINNGPYWPGRDVARGIVLAPGTTKANPGGWILDSWGGVHPFGSAGPIQVSGYWPGQDIARGIAMNADGTGYTVDWWGGVHPLGNSKVPAVSGYWIGRDVARGIVSFGTANNPAGYVLDNFGALNPFGSAPRVDATVYGSWFDARAVVLVP